MSEQSFPLHPSERRSEITDADKLACAEREIAMRRHVYPNRVRQGLMRPTSADREIATMEAIAADYRAKVQPTLELVK
jgi:hypothetical protein